MPADQYSSSNSHVYNFEHYKELSKWVRILSKMDLEVIPIDDFVAPSGGRVRFNVYKV